MKFRENRYRIVAMSLCIGAALIVCSGDVVVAKSPKDELARLTPPAEGKSVVYFFRPGVLGVERTWRGGGWNFRL